MGAGHRGGNYSSRRDGFVSENLTSFKKNVKFNAKKKKRVENNSGVNGN